jgi:hypothetical protein
VRSARSTPAVLAVPAAVLAGHWLGYLLAGNGHHASHRVGHGYLSAAVTVALPALGAALVSVALGSGGRGRRCGEGRGGLPAVASLVGAQWAVFVVQELIEHTLAGDALAAVASPALWVGLAAQVAVAITVWLLLSGASWAGGRAVDVFVRVVRSLHRARQWSAPPVLPPVDGTLLLTVSSRGPPRRGC